MRQTITWPAIAGIVTFFGCAPPTPAPTDDSLLGAVLASESESGAGSDTELAPANPGLGHSAVSGRVVGTGTYQLYDLGPCTAGDHWAVVNTGIGYFDRFTVVLFDANRDLLMRTVMSGSVELQHIMRHNSDRVYLGVMPAAGSSGGDFAYAIHRLPGVGAPVPARQVVWLNFAGGTNVSVHRRAGISFEPLDGAMLGERYAGGTAEIKQAIVRAMLEDYAGLDVAIHTSDETGPPAGPYSTIHFGGTDSGLLGLADNVDHYNENPSQNAIIYVGTFANYAVMELEPDEMGQMIGNVASHELGHLLGLYHTRDPSELMDSTGSAWELAENQCFGRAPLEETVFPAGMENSPRLLAETLGRTASAATLKAPLDKQKLTAKALIRAFARDEIRFGCGTCLAIDE